MSTTTMQATVARTQPRRQHGVSQLTPVLLALVLLGMTGLVAFLMFGPMH